MKVINQNDQLNSLPKLVRTFGVNSQFVLDRLLPKLLLSLVRSLRHWLDTIEIHDPNLAHFLSRAIPAQCPFERDITLLGRKVGHVPPLCKLNPFYEQLVGLRFRALCFLAD